uniref:Uncharacterized protein n=1 Tax=Myoviridae sp. ctKkB1 TaxID=2825081 RepID=A0A8S5V4G9_9CAUD|nr:MAG TPA: hypothetical protein [Myoviridae sp. ctKkB1]
MRHNFKYSDISSFARSHPEHQTARKPCLSSASSHHCWSTVGLFRPAFISIYKPWYLPRATGRQRSGTPLFIPCLRSAAPYETLRLPSFGMWYKSFSSGCAADWYSAHTKSASCSSASRFSRRVALA